MSVNSAYKTQNSLHRASLRPLGRANRSIYSLNYPQQPRPTRARELVSVFMKKCSKSRGPEKSPVTENSKGRANRSIYPQQPRPTMARELVSVIMKQCSKARGPGNSPVTEKSKGRANSQLRVSIVN